MCSRRVLTEAVRAEMGVAGRQAVAEVVAAADLLQGAVTEIATEGDPDRLQIEIATVAGVEGGRGTEVEGTPGARGPHRDHHPQDPRDLHLRDHLNRPLQGLHLDHPGHDPEIRKMT